MTAPMFGHRYTAIPDSGVVELHCGTCPDYVKWRVGYHPSIDVLIEQARAHDVAEHDNDSAAPPVVIEADDHRAVVRQGDTVLAVIGGRWDGGIIVYASVEAWEQARDFDLRDREADVSAAAAGMGQPGLAAERERADRAEAKAAACEGGIDWVTSCLSCTAETSRREGAEGKLAEAVLLLGEIREYARSWAEVAMRLSTPETRAEADCGRKILGLIDADAPTDDDENGARHRRDRP